MKVAMSSHLSDGADGEAPLSGDSWGGETDWSLIKKASGGAPAHDRDRIWVDLIHRYEKPVRRVLGRQLRGDPAVEDAVQDFFSDLFQRRQILERADPGQGRFRCYIQGVIRRYALQWKRAHGAKTACDVNGIDVPDVAEDTLEREEELEWTYAILEHATERLKRESKRDAEILLGFYGLLGHPVRTVEEMARERSLSPATLHVALHRARTKLRAAFLEELKPMVTSQEDMRAELDFLIARLCTAHPGLTLDD